MSFAAVQKHVAIRERAGSWISLETIRFARVDQLDQLLSTTREGDD